jgi:hypothetical protein
MRWWALLALGPARRPDEAVLDRHTLDRHTSCNMHHI